MRGLRRRHGRARSRLDVILDSVTPRHEVTLDARDLTPSEVEHVYSAARARGLHASGTQGWVLIRDMGRST